MIVAILHDEESQLSRTHAFEANREISSIPRSGAARFHKSLEIGPAH